MTRRYYHDDAYRTSFQADVLEWTEHDGQPALVLEGTFFYPTSGGQPYDLGSINSSNVINVLIRPGDSAILHVLDEPSVEKRVSAEIEWRRRFDHMQQHTGQHILSQSFLKTMGASTLSFHLGADSSTIDLDLSDLDEDSASSVEQLANRIIWENRAVDIRTVTRQETEDVAMRKKSPVVGDSLRLVMIADFDVSACGGTHVAKTGEVGLIKIIGWERRRRQIRAEFVCGNRALSDYRAKNQVVRNLSSLLTTGYWELESSVERQVEENSALRRQLRKHQKTLIDYQVAELLNKTEGIEAGHPVVKVFAEVSAKELRIIANEIIARKQVVSLLASVGNDTNLVFAKNESSRGDMNALVKEAFSLLGSGSGGGSSTFAQGKSEVREVSEVIAVLDRISTQLRSS